MLPNIVLFRGEDALNDSGLWETNGTGIGTFELAPSGAGAQGLSPSGITVLGGQVLFEGVDSSGDSGLWTSDGTAVGTLELTSIPGASSAGLAPSGLTVLGSEALFSGINASGQTGLWTTDGTASGTFELAGIIGAAAAGVAPTDLTVFNHEALFTGTDTAGHLGLWVTNGTAGGTKELSGIAGAATTGLDPNEMMIFNNEVLFNGVDAAGLSGLWVTDGTVGGTHEFFAGAGGASDPAGLNPTNITGYNSELLFSGLDASGDMGLWVSDGTVAGTQELTGVLGADAAGLAPSDLTAYNGEVLFRGLDQSGRPQLWITNGTAAGTHELTGIANAATTGTGFDPSGFTLYDGVVLFSGVDSSGHVELWETDGTAAGTAEINPSSATQSLGLFPADLTALTPPVQHPAALNNFSWAQGWGSPDNPREVVSTATNPSGGADYVGFGFSSVVMAFGESTANGPTFANSIGTIHNFGSAEGYTTAAQRGAADTGDSIAPTVYGQGFKGVYWYDATGGAGNNPTYQATANLYPNFGTQQGWSPANGFDVVKADNMDAYASILGFGNAGIVVGPQAFDPSTAGAPPAAYLLPFAAGNNSGWSQTTDIRSFLDSDGNAIDLNGDGVADFVGMGPQGLEFAYGSDSAGGHYTLGPLQLAQISGTNSNFGDTQGWNDSNTTRDIVKDPTTGYDDIIAFGNAGVYVSMGQNPATHADEPFGQAYLALNNFGANQGWSNTLTPRLVGDVSGDGIPDIVGFGASNTFMAQGSYDPGTGHLIFTMEPSATIHNYGYTEGWSTSNTVRTLADVDGSGMDSLVLTGASGTQALKLG